MTHPYFDKAKHPRVLAHRGLVTTEGEHSGVWENTAASFAAAHALGADFIESDCRTTSDGAVVLFHDDTIERLTGEPRVVSEMSLKELRRLFEDHGGLLTVAEALDAFPESRFNIDVKTDAAASPVGAIVADHVHRVLLTSFSDDRRRKALTAVADAGARMRPATSGGSATIMKVRALSALGLSPARALADVDALQIPERQGPVKVLTPALLAAAHRHGVEVHVWTVNDSDDMHRLVDAGVDGMVSDRADLALKVLQPS